MISGHAPQDASALEWDQAKRELLNIGEEAPSAANLDQADEATSENVNQEPALANE